MQAALNGPAAALDVAMQAGHSGLAGAALLQLGPLALQMGGEVCKAGGQHGWLLTTGTASQIQRLVGQQEKLEELDTQQLMEAFSDSTRRDQLLYGEAAPNPAARPSWQKAEEA